MALTLSAYEKIVNMGEWYYMDYKVDFLSMLLPNVLQLMFFEYFRNRYSWVTLHPIFNSALF